MVSVYDGCEKMLTVVVIVVAFKERRNGLGSEVALLTP
jgi:hypothetical protein